MLLPESPPKHEALRRLAETYPEFDEATMLAYLALLQAADRLTRDAERRLAKHGVSQGRFAILVLLNRESTRASTPTRLAEDLGCAKATVTGLVQGMIKSGLLTREPCPDDRRACKVRLTSAAEDALAAILPSHIGSVVGSFRALSAEQLAELTAVCGSVRPG